ncbi:MAG: PEP-CTERM sorting domain-containing protein [Betaproteobacteria bacterium]|jgi:hypothetical protein
MLRIIVALVTAVSACSAFAGAPPAAVPEPGTFELLALGGVVAAIVAIRNRRK